MSEYTTVVCDGNDCYERIHDYHSADAHDSEEGFITAYKRIPFNQKYPDSDLDLLVDDWITYCRECASHVDLQQLRDNGYKVQTPEGYEEGEVCPDCFHGTICPGMRDNGLKPWTGRGAEFAINPDFKQWPCETCNKSGRETTAGYLKMPVIDSRGRR